MDMLLDMCVQPQIQAQDPVTDVARNKLDLHMLRCLSWPFQMLHKGLCGSNHMRPYRHTICLVLTQFFLVPSMSLIQYLFFSSGCLHVWPLVYCHAPSIKYLNRNQDDRLVHLSYSFLSANVLLRSNILSPALPSASLHKLRATRNGKHAPLLADIG